MPPGENVLTAALAAGIPLPYSCRAGRCASCKAKLLSGTIDYPDGLTGGLRRSTDALRAVLERTRGDVTTTIVATRLQAAIEGRTSGEGPTGF